MHGKSFAGRAWLLLCTGGAVRASTYNRTNGVGDQDFTSGANLDMAGNTALTAGGTAFIDLDVTNAALFSSGMSQSSQRFYIGPASGTSGGLYMDGCYLTGSVGGSTSRNRIGRNGGPGRLSITGGSLQTLRSASTSSVLRTLN